MRKIKKFFFLLLCVSFLLFLNFLSAYSQSTESKPELRENLHKNSDISPSLRQEIQLGNVDRPSSERGAKSEDETDKNREKVKLSFHEVLEMALKNNAKTRLAAEQSKEAHAQSFAALSGVLPNISGTVYQNRQTVNLAAQGITSAIFPGLDSTLIGPFPSFDARIRLIQNIFNLESVYQLKTVRSNTRVVELKEIQTREQVMASTAQAYLSVFQTRENIDAVSANLKLAQNLLKLAQNQYQSGLATGIDASRARTRIAEEESRLIQAKSSADQAEIRLKRIIGLPMATSLTLTDPLRYQSSDKKISVQEAMEIAESTRLEIRIAKEELRRAQLEEKTMASRQLPSINGSGDYGASGNRPDDNVAQTYRIGVQLNIPIFDGAKMVGDIRAAKSQKKQAELLLEDMNLQVEEEIRIALKNLESSSFQVQSTEKTFNFALQELKMSLDRFAAGLSSNIEVVNAQTNVATARERKVQALTQYYSAQINLAVALGKMESFQL